MEYDSKTLRKVGKILNVHKMGTIPSGEEKKVPNPLWSVGVYDDEIEDLLKGELPEDWEGV